MKILIQFKLDIFMHNKKGNCMKVSKFRKQLLAEKHNIYTRMRYYYLSISSHIISFMVLSTQENIHYQATRLKLRIYTRTGNCGSVYFESRDTKSPDITVKDPPIVFEPIFKLIHCLLWTFNYDKNNNEWQFFDAQSQLFPFELVFAQK